MLQILAARMLGAAGLGAFALLLAILTLLNAVQTGWVGDSLTVLDRFDPGVRGALFTSQLIGLTLAFAASASLALLLHLTDGLGALLFAALVGLWITEELGRRLLMARQQFWLLAINDSCYVVATLAALALYLVVVGRPTLTTFIGTMVVGSVAAIMLALVQLPRSEWQSSRMSWHGLREVSNFALWRSAQTGIKPLTLLAVRIFVSTLTSRALLGSLEAARLLLAPATSFVAGVGSFLLSSYSRDVHVGRGRMPMSGIYRTMALLLSVVVTTGALAIVFLDPLAHVLTQDRFAVSALVVLGWTAYAAAFAVGVPPAIALVARRASRDVFLLRVLDSCVGLLAVVVVLLLGAPKLVPYALALGSFLGAALLCLSASRSARMPV